MLVSIEGSPIINQKWSNFGRVEGTKRLRVNSPGRLDSPAIPWGQKKPAAEIYGWLNQE